MPGFKTSNNSSFYLDNDEQNYQAYFMRATVYLAMAKARSALPDLNQVLLLEVNIRTTVNF